MNSQAPAEGQLDALFAAIDAQDTDGFLACLTKDAKFRFGSAPAVSGHDAIRGAVDGFFGTVAGLRHVVSKSVAAGPTIFCEGEVTYTRHNGSRITLPFVDVFEIEEGLISDYKIYVDIAPLYAE